MHFIESIYFMSGLLAVCAGMPQLLKIVKTRSSEGFYVATWVFWVFSQSISLTYSIFIGAVSYMILNIIWIGFYISMVLLILRYSESKRLSLRFLSTYATVPSRVKGLLTGNNNIDKL